MPGSPAGGPAAAAGPGEQQQQQQPPPPRQRSAADESDCESECSSEVLSVGNEPPPRLAELELAPADEPGAEPELELGAEAALGEAEAARSPRTSSRTPSPASSALPSPSASSLRSPASSASPGRAEFAPANSELAYPVAALSRPPAGHQELGYPAARLPLGFGLGLPAAARLSLSPPSAMTVSGLAVPCTPLLHPAAQHALGLPQPQPQPQPQQQQSQQQHRLSVDKLLRRDSPEHQRHSLGPQLHLLQPLPGAQQQLQQQQQQQQQQQLAMLANGSGRSNGQQPSNSSNANDNSSLQQQASLKFSIDNILKADFGRRITDPISLKKSRPRKLVARQPIDLSKDFVESSSEGSERGSESSTRNVSPSLPASSPAPSSAATPSVAGAAANESKLIQWPAWVYCTRYSDRPSS
ncbi:protein couch potato-like, partial [Phymastichus coffea]|uniref:protein couch potato-like n=1 Tax=Phymastichus coffea TaxID=108790 RepID=UPI00273C7A0E